MEEPAWKAYGQQIATLRQTLARTDLADAERRPLEDQVAQLLQLHLPEILVGMEGEVQAAAQALEQARTLAKVARQVELSTWDAKTRKAARRLCIDRLIEIQQAIRRLDVLQQSPADQIQHLWDEARASGDKYQVRAVAEVLAEAHLEDLALRQLADRIVAEARVILAQLRTTEQMVRADRAVERAELRLVEQLQAFQTGLEALGETDQEPAQQLLQHVQQLLNPTATGPTGAS